MDRVPIVNDARENQCWKLTVNGTSYRCSEGLHWFEQPYRKSITLDASVDATKTVQELFESINAFTDALSEHSLILR